MENISRTPVLKPQPHIQSKPNPHAQLKPDDENVDPNFPIRAPARRNSTGDIGSIQLKLENENNASDDEEENCGQLASKSPSVEALRSTRPPPTMPLRTRSNSPKRNLSRSPRKARRPSITRTPIIRASSNQLYTSPTGTITAPPSTTPQRPITKRERRTPKTKKVTFDEKEEQDESGMQMENVDLLVGGALDFALLLRKTFPPEENDEEKIYNEKPSDHENLMNSAATSSPAVSGGSCPFLKTNKNGYHIKLYLPGIEKLCPVYNLPRRTDFTVSVFMHSIQRMYNMLNVSIPPQLSWSELAVRKFEDSVPLSADTVFKPKRDSYYVLEPREITLVVRVPKLNVRYRFQLFQKQFCVQDVKTVCMARAQISIPHYQALEIPLTRDKIGKTIPLKNSLTIYRLNLRAGDELVYDIPEEIISKRTASSSKELSIISRNQDIQEILLIFLSAILILAIFLILWYYLQGSGQIVFPLGAPPAGGASGGSRGFGRMGPAGGHVFGRPQHRLRR